MQCPLPVADLFVDLAHPLETAAAGHALQLLGTQAVNESIGILCAVSAEKQRCQPDAIRHTVRRQVDGAPRDTFDQLQRAATPSEVIAQIVVGLRARRIALSMAYVSMMMSATPIRISC